MKLGRLLVKTGKGMILLGLMAALYAYAMFQGGFVSWFLFYSVLFVMVCNILLVLYPLRRLTVERQCSRQMLSYNEKLNVTLHVKKNLPFPFLFLSVEDEVPPGLEGMGQAPGTIYFMAGSRHLTYSYEIRGGRRGEYWFAPVTLRTGDLFGFFQKEYQVHLPQSLTVLPRLRPLKRWNALWNDQQETVPVTAKMMEETFSIAGVRDYIPGDKMTSVDWKISARTGKLVTKEFESQEGKGWTVIMDNTREQPREAFEEMVEFAASLIDHCYKQAIPAGFGVSTAEETLLEEGTKRTHFQKIYQELAKLEIRERTFDSALYFRQPQSRSSIVYITSFMSPQRAEELLRLLRQRNELVIAMCRYDKTEEIHREQLDMLRRQGADIMYVLPGDSAFDLTS
ncbi:DUF58 domain-containing protein [Salibacterium aidingense]|uniref:DUF58 domain-containing protein n=1 Tax=Salibacterium aidingense TaxID=384933 RepID=UPI0003FC8938|nr:DUF58 domain-containing protein [Salibacterium aidingense]